MIQRKPRPFPTRPPEPAPYLPERSECSSQEYVDWRTRIMAYIGRGATPRMVAERIAEGLDRFPRVVSLRGEMHDYAEMGDCWCPPDRRDLWEHYRALPRGGGNVMPKAGA